LERVLSKLARLSNFCRAAESIRANFPNDSELFSIPTGYSPVDEAHPFVASHIGRSMMHIEEEDGESSLNFAAASDIDGVRSQLAEGVNVNTKGYRDETALMAASECGNTVIVEELLRAGADVNLRGSVANIILR
jgi:hypothetical protein